MFCFYLALAYPAGALTAGLLFLFILCLLTAAARREEERGELDPPRSRS